ncbi:hypothetical protein AAKU64_000060 [Undibacterium sp. GrIS 1.8]
MLNVRPPLKRLARLAILYVVISLISVPAHIVLSFPHYPTSFIGWLAFVALPIPLAIAVEWLLRYRPMKLIDPIDAWASRVERSPYRLAIIVGVLAMGCALGLAAAWLFS